MSFVLQYKWFKVVAYGICTIFIAVMAFVGFKAYTRRSGNTGLDMAKIQQMRYEANRKNSK